MKGRKYIIYVLLPFYLGAFIEEDIVNYKVCVRGISAVTPLGENTFDLKSSLKTDKSSIKTSDKYPFKEVFDRFKEYTGKEVIGSFFDREKNSTFKNEKKIRYQIIDKAFAQVLLNSKMTEQEITNADLIVGTCVGGSDAISQKILFKEEGITAEDAIGSFYTNYLRKKYKFNGRTITFSTACASSANAVSYGYDLIKNGLSELVLICGVDFLSYLTYFGFTNIDSIDEDMTKPFSKNHNGINLGECVSFMLLERAESIEKTQIQIASKIEQIDNYSITSPNPNGKLEENGMRQLLKNSKLANSKKIGYINAHGTGTKANDEMEYRAIKSAFSDMNYYVSSTKSFHGHTLGPAGLLESVICVLVLQNNFIPPTLRLKPSLPHYCSESVNSNVQWAVSNSFAFGGNAVSILFMKGDN